MERLGRLLNVVHTLNLGFVSREQELVIAGTKQNMINVLQVRNRFVAMGACHIHFHDFISQSKRFRNYFYCTCVHKTYKKTV